MADLRRKLNTTIFVPEISMKFSIKRSMTKRLDIPGQSIYRTAESSETLGQCVHFVAKAHRAKRVGPSHRPSINSYGLPQMWLILFMAPRMQI